MRKTKAEEDSTEHLLRRTPAEWVAIVKMPQAEKVRHEFAKLIWWDWFGARGYAQRWNHLDKYLKKDCDQKKLTPKKLYSLLKLAGYPEWLALKRSHCEA